MVVVIYLLDTDALISLIRGMKSTRKGSVARLRAEQVAVKCQQSQARGDTVGTSSITVSELEFGAQRSRNYEREIRVVRRALAPFESFAYEPVVCPVHYGRLRMELETAGQPIGALDMLIAAHALALEAVLVTNNTDHFKRIEGLHVENWVR